jgi:hypothetical protein
VNGLPADGEALRRQAVGLHGEQLGRGGAGADALAPQRFGQGRGLGAQQVAGRAGAAGGDLHLAGVAQLDADRLGRPGDRIHEHQRGGRLGRGVADGQVGGVAGQPPARVGDGPAQAGTLRGGGLESGGGGEVVGGDAALQALAAGVAAAGLHQQRHGAGEAEVVARDAGRGAAGGDDAFVRLAAGVGEVGVGAEAEGVELRLHGGAEGPLRQGGHRARHRGVGGLQEHGVPRRQRAEAGEPGAGGGVLVRVQHQVGRELGGQRMQRAGLRQRTQQVVAVEVEVGAGAAAVVGGAVGVGAGDQHHADAVEQRGQLAVGERRGQRQHRLPAGGLVAVLVSHQPDHRAVQFADAPWVGEALLGEQEVGHLATLLAAAERTQAHPPRAPGQRVQVRRHLGLRGEGGAAGLQRRRVERDRNVGVARQHRGALAVARLDVVRLRQREGRREHSCGEREKRPHPHPDSGKRRLG